VKGEEEGSTENRIAVAEAATVAAAVESRVGDDVAKWRRRRTT